MIDEQKRESLSVLNTESLQLVLGGLPDGIWVCDREGRLLMVNEAARRCIGVDPDEELEGPLETIVNRLPEANGRRGESAVPAPVLLRALGGEVVTDEELSVRHLKTGERVRLQLNAHPLRDGSGELLGALAVVRDVTEQRSREYDLKSLLAELYSDRARFKAIIDNAPDLIMRFDADYRCIFVNPAVEEFMGYPVETFFGGTLEEDGFPEGIASFLKRKMAEMFRSGKEESGELVFPMPSGENVYHLRLSPEYSEEGEIESILILGRDITGIKALERQLRLEKERSERANRAKSEFLAHMSHEIRTPIGGILGLIELLQSRITNDENLNLLNLLKDSARSLLRIINDILDLSKIESGKMDIIPEEFSLRHEIQKIISTFTVPAIEKGLSLVHTISDEVPDYLYGDPSRIGQILRNLVSNAIKYTENGGVTIAVTPEEKGDDFSVLEVRVSDTGIGIPPDKQQLLFSSFTQIENYLTKAIEGTGLGLAISKKLVEMMGGRIWVESLPGEGSTFAFTIRLEHGREASPQIPGGSEAGSFGLKDFPPLSILVAEDNRINQMFIEVSLNDAGHRVKIAANGKDAVEAVQNERFDCVLMDLQMPVMDGIEATRRIRELDSFERHIPIIALTAFAMKEDEERFRNAGMDGYVTKPIDFNRLAEVIARVSAVR